MRKRMVMGAVAAAVVVIGMVVAVYVLSKPKRGTIEYHKRKYAEAHGVGMPERWLEGRAHLLHDAFWRRRQKRIHFHRRALFECGYLTKREFVVSNRPPRHVASVVWNIAHFAFTNQSDNTLGFTFMRQTDTNRLTVTGPAEAMDKLGELIREADVPESGK